MLEHSICFLLPKKTDKFPLDFPLPRREKKRKKIYDFALAIGTRGTALFTRNDCWKLGRK